MKRKPITGKERIELCDNEVKPLMQRESSLNTRKGMIKQNCKGFFDVTEYKEQLIFKK